MSNIKENLIKVGLIFLGGGLLYYAFKPSTTVGFIPKESTPASNAISTSFNSEIKKENTPEPSIENANIVATAYADAMQNGEPPSKLTELNQECMKDFGLRAYVKDNMLFVCDASGNTVITK